jgi:predicted lipoprotein
MKRSLSWLIALAALGGLCWLFPLFHLVPLGSAGASGAAAAFQPAPFAERFWTNQLLPGLDQAVKAEVLLPALEVNPAAARKKFSPSPDLGGSYFYFLAGRGQVVAISDDEISLAVVGGATNAQVALVTGLVFGNAVRDGTGLLNVSDFPNSQDFNAVAEALNQLVETRVLPSLREKAKLGATIRFAGCAEIASEPADLQPLRVIPVLAEVE